MDEQVDFSLRWAYMSEGRLSDIAVPCLRVLWPSQPNRVMSSAVSLPKHSFTGQALSFMRLTSACAPSLDRS